MSELTELVTEIKEIKEKLNTDRKEYLELEKSKEKEERDIKLEIVFNKELKNKEQRDIMMEKKLSESKEVIKKKKEITDLHYNIKKTEIEVEYLERIYKIEIENLKNLAYYKE